MKILFYSSMPKRGDIVARFENSGGSLRPQPSSKLVLPDFLSRGDKTFLSMLLKAEMPSFLPRIRSCPARPGLSFMVTDSPSKFQKGQVEYQLRQVFLIYNLKKYLNFSSRSKVLFEFPFH